MGDGEFKNYKWKSYKRKFSVDDATKGLVKKYYFKKGTFTPRWVKFESKNEMIVNKNKKDVLFKIDPLKPSRNYGLVIAYDNEELINKLVETIDLIARGHSDSAKIRL